MALKVTPVTRCERMALEHKGGNVGIHQAQGHPLLSTTTMFLEPVLKALKLVVVPKSGPPADEIVELGAADPFPSHR
jgi:hypothetical protein